MLESRYLMTHFVVIGLVISWKKACFSLSVCEKPFKLGPPKTSSLIFATILQTGIYSHPWLLSKQGMKNLFGLTKGGYSTFISPDLKVLSRNNLLMLCKVIALLSQKQRKHKYFIYPLNKESASRIDLPALLTVPEHRKNSSRLW